MTYGRGPHSKKYRMTAWKDRLNFTTMKSETYKIKIDTEKSIEIQVVVSKDSFSVYSRLRIKTGDTYSLRLKDPKTYSLDKYKAFYADLISRGAFVV